MKARLILLLILSIAASLPAPVLADVRPTFTLSGETFELKQENDFPLGNFERRLAPDEIIAKLEAGPLQDVQYFDLKYDTYTYFVYVVSNDTSDVHQGVLSWDSQMPETVAWRYDAQEKKLHRLPEVPAVSNAIRLDAAPGLTYVVCQRKSLITLRGPLQGVYFSDWHSFSDTRLKRSHAYGLSFGFVSAIVIAALGLYLSTRKSHLLLYTVYCLASSGIFAMLKGYIALRVDLFSLLVAVAGVGLVAFTNQCLETARHLPRIHRISWFIMGLLLLLALWCLVQKNWGLLQLGIPIAMGFTFVVSLRRFRDDRGARLFAIGCGAFWVLSVLYIINAIRPLHPMLSHAALIGFLLEIACFSAGIGDSLTRREQT
jgi:hypothetical protein